MRRTIALLALAALAGPASARGAEGMPPNLDSDRLRFFEGKVRPVLEAHCVGCHGPARQKAGLRLDSREALIRGGDSGPAIEPGRPEGSRLIEAVNHSADLRMPPKERLKEAEVVDLARWVRDGAPWTESTAEVRPALAPTGRVTAEDRAFWSFRPVGDPTVPPVRDESWPRNAVDRFVLAELEARGLRPVAPADRRALIRRAAFDLVGLPPTPGEVEAFVEDPSPEAFARVVDRLLASPHYGERWGRHWLDVARYGEDQAHTFQARLYPQGYRYRDWVTQALNDDMPYDRFVVEQVAGDLVEGPGREARLAALGFFALGPVYYGGAVYDELDDRVDTLTRGFLGLTVACARCHDHKFDPIPTADYYALAGVFSSTAYKEYPDAPPEAVAAYDRAQAAIKAKTAEVADLLRVESARRAESMASAESARYLAGAWALANRRKGGAKVPTAEFAKGEGLDAALLDRWAKYLESKPDDRRPHLAAWRDLIGAQDPAVDLSGDAGARAEVARVAAAFQGRIRAARAVVDVFGAAGPAADLLREVASADGPFGLPKDQVEKDLPAEARSALKARRAELERLKAEGPPKYPVVHSLAEGPSPADMKVFLRGNPATPGPEAPRRFLTALSAEGAPAFGPKGSGRLELARAIASPANPLTARVIVNRVWEHHFGRGLVATPSNFGRMGEPPSHPALLDHLARRLVASGWSLKALHREVMLSATYGLAAADDPANAEVDPANVFLWRANRRRLEVEPWRDAMLAASGLLDPRVGGPSADLAAPENRRRTAYAKVSRHSLDNLLRLFDFPDPNITADKRTVTAVPLQQLFVLNSEFLGRQSRALAARLAGGPGDDADRVRRAFPLLYARPATDREVAMAVEFLAPEGEGKARLARWEQYAQVLLGASEFLFLD